jgi:hypothetical protein
MKLDNTVRWADGWRRLNAFHTPVLRVGSKGPVWFDDVVQISNANNIAAVRAVSHGWFPRTKSLAAHGCRGEPPPGPLS